MLFHMVWEFIDSSAEGSKESLAAFQRWQPPAGADFSRGFYGFADGTGGMAIVDVDSVETMARTTATWAPWLRFEVTPILPIDQSAAINAEAVAWREGGA